MKPHPVERSPQEVIADLPVVRQDAPTVLRLRAELRRIRRLIAAPSVLGIFGMVWIMGVGALMMVVFKMNPALAAQTEQSGAPARLLMLLWFAVIPVAFVGGLGLPSVLPWWIDRRIRGREAAFCDTQLIGDLIDLGRAIDAAGSSLQRGWYAGCVLAWLARLLPDLNAQQAAALTDRQRDFLAGKALVWQEAAEEFVLAALRSAPVWGDMEALVTLLRISESAESETVRAAALASLSPLKERLEVRGEDAALIHSLGIPSVAS